MKPKRTPAKSRLNRLIKMRDRMTIEAILMVEGAETTPGQWRSYDKLSRNVYRLAIGEKRHGEKLLAAVKSFVRDHTYRPRKAAQCAT